MAPHWVRIRLDGRFRASLSTILWANDGIGCTPRLQTDVEVFCFENLQEASCRINPRHLYPNCVKPVLCSHNFRNVLGPGRRCCHTRLADSDITAGKSTSNGCKHAKRLWNPSYGVFSDFNRLPSRLPHKCCSLGCHWRPVPWKGCAP